MRLALCDDAPSAAVTVVVPSEAMFPIAAEKVAAEFPLVTVTLGGTVIALEGELTLTTAFDAAGCES